MAYQNRGYAFLADNRPAQAIAESDHAFEILSALKKGSGFQTGELLIRTETLRFVTWKSLNDWSAAARALLFALEIATSFHEQWQSQNPGMPPPWYDVLVYLASQLHALSATITDGSWPR